MESMGLLKSIRVLVAELDSTVTISDCCTLQERVDETFIRERFSLFLYGFFSIAALLLASLGLYGVMAYAVNLRQREIGIRIALGADRANVLGLILKKGCLMAGIGIGIGILGALSVIHVMSSMLYQVKPFDPATFMIVPLLLITVALLACWIPARRAAKTDPMEALRYE